MHGNSFQVTRETVEGILDHLGYKPFGKPKRKRGKGKGAFYQEYRREKDDPRIWLGEMILETEYQSTSLFLPGVKHRVKLFEFLGEKDDDQMFNHTIRR